MRKLSRAISMFEMKGIPLDWTWLNRLLQLYPSAPLRTRSEANARTSPRKTVGTITFFLVIILASIQNKPVDAQSVISFSCEHFRLVRYPGLLEEPPVRLRDFVLGIFPDRQQWIIAYVQEDGNLTRGSPRRIAGVNNNEIILSRSSFAGRIDSESKFDNGSLIYSDIEYNYSGEINRHTHGRCARVR
jgi:hypothetical protein